MGWPPNPGSRLGAEADIARGRATAGLLDQLETRAAELEADNHQVGRQVADLQAKLREATDSLNAVRNANRDRMETLSRRPPPSARSLLSWRSHRSQRCSHSP